MTPLVTTDSLVPASFYRKEEFDHFENPEHPNCHACNSMLLAVRPLKVTKKFMLVPATALVDGQFKVIPGQWQVYPRRHVTHLADMPDDWTASVKKAWNFLRLETSLTVNDNWGPDAGQTAQHAHTWLIPRGGEEGLLSHKLGTSTILRLIADGAIPRD